jgi:hypothetical protein
MKETEMDRALVVVAGVVESASVEERNYMLRLSLQHFAENITDEQIGKGIVEWPEGEGEMYLLPTRIANAAGEAFRRIEKS